MRIGTLPPTGRPLLLCGLTTCKIWVIWQFRGLRSFTRHIPNDGLEIQLPRFALVASSAVVGLSQAFSNSDVAPALSLLFDLYLLFHARTRQPIAYPLIYTSRRSYLPNTRQCHHPQPSTLLPTSRCLQSPLPNQNGLYF